jgi:hypothetical protein
METSGRVLQKGTELTLNEWASSKKKRIFDALSNLQPPPEGEYDSDVLRDGFDKSKPQMGTTVYEPECACFEFIFPDRNSSATVLTVRVAPPERIVFLPVPPWVVETIWQGEVDGTYHFAGEAMKLIEVYLAELTEVANRKWFGPRPAKRRE